MRGNNVLGIVFSNMHDEFLKELTAGRTLGSVPFGGRYRLIDFALSNMVNSGINKVGIITKSNYQSLLDHLGSGKAWDLSRKRGGMILLPPFAQGNALYTSRIQAMAGIFGFLDHCDEEYVLLSDCDVVLNMDMNDLMDAHLKTGADITIAYKYGPCPSRREETMVLNLDDAGRVVEIDIDPLMTDTCSYGLNIYVMRKEHLKRIISEATSRSQTNFIRDVLQSRVHHDRIYGFRINNYIGMMGSLADYYKVNMELLNPAVQEDLFDWSHPIYTKVRDDMPTRYGLGAQVKNSIIADGCLIEGTVENSILFRGVHVCKGARIKDSIIGQDSIISEGVQLSCVILDKNVYLREGRTLMGFETYPVLIAKGAVV